jgi:segregation and condensation protein B
MEQEDRKTNNIKRTVEALIFAAPEPLSFKEIKNIRADIDKKILDQTIAALNEEYRKEGRAFHIIPLGNGWQLVTREEFVKDLKKLYEHCIKTRLSKPALETLSIIAYKQPITKIEIENIRGVNADGMIKSLLKRELIKMTGRKDVPGRPIIYEITNKFLQYFGLASLKDLPNFEEFVKAEKITMNEEEEGGNDEHKEFEGEDQPNRFKITKTPEREVAVC